MKVIKTKDGSLTFHVEGKDNEYCLKYVETKKNGKKDYRENNVNAYEFINGTNTRRREFEQMQERLNEINWKLKMNNKPKNFTELGEQMKDFAISFLKLENSTKIDFKIKQFKEEIIRLETDKKNGVKLVPGKDGNNRPVRMPINEGIKQLNNKIVELGNDKLFLYSPKNENEFFNYFNRFIKKSLNVNKKGLELVKNLHKNTMNEQKNLVVEQLKYYPLAKKWLKENEPKKFKTLFPNEVKK